MVLAKSGLPSHSLVIWVLSCGAGVHDEIPVCVAIDGSGSVPFQSNLQLPAQEQTVR